MGAGAALRTPGLGFTIPYLHNDQAHDYEPDFIVRLKGTAGRPPIHLVLETKGYDMRKEVKAQAARRWVDAVNAEGSYGVWEYAVVESVEAIELVIQKIGARTS